MEGVLTMLIGFILSIFYSWRITLVASCLAPFAIASGYLRG